MTQLQLENLDVTNVDELAIWHVSVQQIIRYPDRNVAIFVGEWATWNGIAMQIRQIVRSKTIVEHSVIGANRS